MFAEKTLHYSMEISKSKMAGVAAQKKSVKARVGEEGLMITIVKHGKEHYRMECEDCSCIFEYDKQDIGEYIENGEQVFKIRCPECGKAIDAGSEQEWRKT